MRLLRIKTLGRVCAAAGLATVVAISGAAAASVAAQARPARTAARILGPGQTGSRAEVPWRDVGPGWTLVTYTNAKLLTSHQHPGRTWIYLVDPEGGRYGLYQTTTAELTLLAWSGDARRASLDVWARNGTTTADQLMLTTGRLSRITLPRNTLPLSYTRPDGTSLLAIRYLGGRDESTQLARYTLSGRLEKRLASIPLGDPLYAQYSPDGQTIAITRGKPSGIDLVGNATGKVTSLPAADGCLMDGWWNATTVLTSGCSNGSLYLVPVSGRPRLLARAPSADTFLQGAWRLLAATYVQSSTQGCGSGLISELERGRLVTVKVAGQPLRAIVIAASKSRLLVLYHRCSGQQSLAVYDPAARSVRTVLAPAPGHAGITSDVPYYEAGGQI
jgi:hypothetical protein